MKKVNLKKKKLFLIMNEKEKGMDNVYKLNIVNTNETKEFNKPIRLKEIMPNDKTYYCAKVNNRLRETNYIIDYEANIEFLDLTNYDSVRIYEATLRYLVAMIIHELDKDCDVVFNYSVSRSILVELKNTKIKIDNKFLNLLNSKLEEIVKKDYPITRKTVSKEEAINIYKEYHYLDKIKALEYRKEDKVHLYECNNYLNYMYSYMAPSTGLINKFKFKLYNPGFIIQYPRSEANGNIPEFIDDHKFGLTLLEEKDWIDNVNGKTIASLNDYIRENNLSDLVNMCETRHNNMLYEIKTQIKNNINNIRLICVAGPSSSGKTTFTNRLRIELMTSKIRPLMISLDNYYLPKEQAPLDDEGNYDLEHIEALDIELFNEQMLSLINGEEVSLPIFDFPTGKRIFQKPIKISKDTPILIEGIHALNEQMTHLVPKHQKYKIYISPQPQYHIDYHNPISITDIRLIRRLVRDKQFRNTNAEETLAMWKSVRRGEFKWIYPYQENADFIFNSELTYELCVLKKYALPALLNIKPDSEYFINANRLIKFLKYYDDIKDDYVPANSILREFIGGSSYYI